MTTLVSEYAIALGSSVALSGLLNVQVLFGRAVWTPNRNKPVDPYPTRIQTLGGRVVGEGRINHEWLFAALPITKLKIIEDTYHTNGTVVSAQVTIYTRLHNRAAYQRYNAWSILPQPGEDYEIGAHGYIRNLRWRFTNLVAL